MANEFKGLLDTLIEKLDDISNLDKGPVAFDATGMPDTRTTPNSSAVYTLDIQTNDTGTSRQASIMRVEHIVTVSLMLRLQQFGNWDTSLGTALDVEQSIIAACLTRADFPTFDVRYIGTARRNNNTNEYMIHDVTFSFEHSIATGGP